VAHLGEIGDALRAARWTWLAAAALASAATYPMAAVQLIGAAGTRLPAGRTIAAQVASAVGGLLAPGGIGGAGVNVRYLERSGMGRAESVAAVTLASTAGFAVHVAALVTLGGILTGTGVPPIPVPSRWILLAVVIGIATLAGAVAWSPIGHRRPPAPVREMALSLWDVLRRPRQAVLLLAGSTGVTAGYVLALWCSLRAFGAQPPPLEVAVAYLAGAAVGAASPTPGGLGAVDAALTGALIRFSVPAGTAVAAVLAFRFATYWLPAVPGAVAFRALRRRGSL
jgi:glycosyltransferase 2 family protein